MGRWALTHKRMLGTLGKSGALQMPGFSSGTGGEVVGRLKEEM